MKEKTTNIFNQSSREDEAPQKKKSKNTKHIDVDRAMGIHFQEEIIIDILSRLPVRSLLQFKCVTKIWKKLISESYFKMKHQTHAMNDLNSKKLLVCHLQRIGKLIYSNFYCSSLSSVQLVDDVQKFDCPSNCKPCYCRIYCSCDGLVLLAIDEQLLLWNPSTRESIELPRSEISLRNSTCGLGYDATSDDYKIIKIIYTPEIYIEILALKSGSWRKKFEYPGSNFDPVLGCMNPLAFVHGAFHWLGLKRNYSIFSFSISDEVYGEIPLLKLERLPNEIRIVHRGISILGGMLCYYHTHISLGEKTFKFSVMKEYGVKESWTELYTIRLNGIGLYWFTPKYRFADGEVLLSHRRSGGVGFVFSTSKGPFGFWPECNITNTCQEGIIYTESMISPKSLI